jgi:hypothetical protein
MVVGLDTFAAHFNDYRDRYILIGGAATWLVPDHAGLQPRSNEFRYGLRPSTSQPLASGDKAFSNPPTQGYPAYNVPSQYSGVCSCTRISGPFVLNPFGPMFRAHRVDQQNRADMPYELRPYHLSSEA